MTDLPLIKGKLSEFRIFTCLERKRNGAFPILFTTTARITLGQGKYVQDQASRFRAWSFGWSESEFAYMQTPACLAIPYLCHVQ